MSIRRPAGAEGEADAPGVEGDAEAGIERETVGAVAGEADVDAEASVPDWEQEVMRTVAVTLKATASASRQGGNFITVRSLRAPITQVRKAVG